MILTLKWILYSLVFVPLLFNTATLSPFVFTKTLAIRIVVTLFWVLVTGLYLFRNYEVKEKLSGLLRFIKNPIYIFFSLFLIILIFSTAFAVNPYRAFWGDIERGEGLLGFFYFVFLFAGMLFVFQKENWVTFFKLNFITGLVLFLDSLGDLANGLTRAQSFIGNPSFLAVYFPFLIFSGLVVLVSSKRKTFWFGASIGAIILGVMGVLLTGTRGAIIGLLVGGFISLTYLLFKSRGVSVRLLKNYRIKLKSLSLILLILLSVFLGAVLLTNENPFWEGVPGVNRFTNISDEGATIQTRLLSMKVGISAMQIENAGVGRLLLGYGLDNLNIAYNTYYDPEYLRYENAWFDRAHNKVFDVLVMNGALGLIAYLGIWVSLFFVLFKGRIEKKYVVPILFFGTAYFIQNLAAFDQPSTYLSFFSYLAFVIYLSSSSLKEELSSGLRNLVRQILPYKFIGISAFLIYFLVYGGIIPYFQTTTFINAVSSSDPDALLESVDSFSKPYTFAQSAIRTDFISLMTPFIGEEEVEGLVRSSLHLQEDAFSREPYDPRDSSFLANAYRLDGNYDTALRYEEISLALSPKRQDLLFSIGSLYADREDFVRADKYAVGMLQGSPTVPQTNILYGILVTRFGEDRYGDALLALNTAVRDSDVYFSSEREIELIRSHYEMYMSYFDLINDETSFRLASEGLAMLSTRVSEIEMRTK